MEVTVVIEVAEAAKVIEAVKVSKAVKITTEVFRVLVFSNSMKNRFLAFSKKRLMITLVFNQFSIFFMRFYGLGLGLVELIDVKGIGVA